MSRSCPRFAPRYVVWTVLGTMWLALFIPVFVVLGKPLVERRREPRPRPEVRDGHL